MVAQPPAAVSGVGEQAYLMPARIPKSPSNIATLTAVKANVVTAVQVWKDNAPVDDIAKSAAQQVLARIK